MLTSLQNLSHTLDWPSFMLAREKEANDLRIKRYYQAGIDLDIPLSNASFVALDIETTGLNPEQDDIVSLGFIPFTLNGIFCRDGVHRIVKPQQPLEEEVIVIHGITHSDISSQPDFESRLDELLQAITGKIAVVHCLDIERNFIYNAVKQRIGEGVIFPMIDTMAIEQGIQTKQLGFFDKLRKRKLPSLRLSEVRKRYNLPDYQNHHALHDAFATAELFQAQVAHHFSQDTEVKTLVR